MTTTDYRPVWDSLPSDTRDRLARRAHQSIDVEDVRALPMVDGAALTSHEAYEYGAERSEGHVLMDDFADWIDVHTSEGRYARGWEALTPDELERIAASENGEVPEGLVLKLAHLVGVSAAYWTDLQTGPDRWDVGVKFVMYVRERLASERGNQ